jgi:hypothetical protein
MIFPYREIDRHQRGEALVVQDANVVVSEVQFWKAREIVIIKGEIFISVGLPLKQSHAWTQILLIEVHDVIFLQYEINIAPFRVDLTIRIYFRSYNYGGYKHFRFDDEIAMIAENQEDLQRSLKV